MEQIVRQVIKQVTDGKHKIYFVFGFGDKDMYEEISDRILINLVDVLGDDIKFIPKSLIKDGNLDFQEKFPMHNIKDAKYLLVTGVTEYNDLDKGFIKSLVDGDEFYCGASYRNVSTQRPKIIIFWDKDPSDYLCEETSLGFLHRLKCIENGIIL